MNYAHAYQNDTNASNSPSNHDVPNENQSEGNGFDGVVNSSSAAEESRPASIVSNGAENDTDEENEDIAAETTIPESTNNINSAPSNVPTNVQDAALAHHKRQRRLRMNRVTARLRRKRKREHIDTLKDQVELITVRNDELRASNNQLREQISYYKSILEKHATDGPGNGSQAAAENKVKSLLGSPHSDASIPRPNGQSIDTTLQRCMAPAAVPNGKIDSAQKASDVHGGGACSALPKGDRSSQSDDQNHLAGTNLHPSTSRLGANSFSQGVRAEATRDSRQYRNTSFSQMEQGGLEQLLLEQQLRKQTTTSSIPGDIQSALSGLIQQNRNDLTPTLPRQENNPLSNSAAFERILMHHRQNQQMGQQELFIQNRLRQLQEQQQLQQRMQDDTLRNQLMILNAARSSRSTLHPSSLSSSLMSGGGNERDDNHLLNPYLSSVAALNKQVREDQSNLRQLILARHSQQNMGDSDHNQQQQQHQQNKDQSSQHNHKDFR